MFGRRRRAVEEGGTIVVRVPPGEHVDIRIVAGGYDVKGDAGDFARELFDNAKIRLDGSKRRSRAPLDEGAGAGAFVAGAALEDAADSDDD